MSRPWGREIERAERHFERQYEFARTTRSMYHARRAVYARRYVIYLCRCRDFQEAFAGVPGMAVNSLRRLARRSGVDPWDPVALRALVREQGRPGLLGVPLIGKRSADALLAWAVS